MTAEANESREGLSHASTAGSIERHLRASGKFEHVPEVHVHVHLSSHVNDVDARRLLPHLQGSDIFIPELLGWPKERITDLDRIATGELSVEDVPWKYEMGPFAPFLTSLFTVIRGSGVKIRTADLPTDSPLLGQIAASARMQRELPNILREETLTFDEAASGTQRFYQTFGGELKERERYIADRLTGCVQDVLEQNPSLAEKESIRVVLMIGAAHSSLHSLIASENPGASRSFALMPHLYSFSEELIRSRLWNLKLTPERESELVECALIEALLPDLARNMSGVAKEYVDVQAAMRFFVTLFSPQQRREFYSISMHDEDAATDYFARLVEQSGVPLSPEGFREFAANYRTTVAHLRQGKSE